MNVIVEVVGEEISEVVVDDDGIYVDFVWVVDFSFYEVIVFVDGCFVFED